MPENGSTKPGVHLPGNDTLERPLPKRFYKDATVREESGGWAPVLDGRPVRTPGKNQLVAPSEALAKAIAEEWAAQIDVIDPTLMPLTRMANTALDGVTGKEAEVRAEITSFAGSDLLCYRAEHPQELIARQMANWDRPLAWLAEAHGVHLKCGAGIMPVAQDPRALEEFAQLLEGVDALRLAALHVMVTLTGSTVLAYAVFDGHMQPDEAWSAAHVDEDWQISQWGEDLEAEARRAVRLREFTAAALFLRLLG